MDKRDGILVAVICWLTFLFVVVLHDANRERPPENAIGRCNDGTYVGSVIVLVGHAEGPESACKDHGGLKEIYKP